MKGSFDGLLHFELVLVERALTRHTRGHFVPAQAQVLVGKLIHICMLLD